MMKTMSAKFLLGVFCLSFSSFLCAHGGEHHHDGQTWPPQPTGITNVLDQSDPGSEQITLSQSLSRMNTLENNAKQQPQCKSYLGRKFTRIALIDKVDEQTGKITGSTMVFFSHDKNATIEVDFVNNRIKSIKSTPARIYQPEITDEEAAQAQTLALNYFLNKGYDKVAELKAYSILAYKPEGVGFYDTRVIYVTFHAHDDSPPEYRAWVDLTRRQVIKTGENQ